MINISGSSTSNLNVDEKKQKTETFRIISFHRYAAINRKEWNDTPQKPQPSRKWHDIKWNEMKLNLTFKIVLKCIRVQMQIYFTNEDLHFKIFVLHYFRRVSSVDHDLSVSFFNSSQNWYYLFASFLTWEFDKQVFVLFPFLFFHSQTISIYSSNNMKWYCFW